jgi:hypothetical protein
MTEGLISDEVLAKASEGTGAPLPTDIAPNARKFEQWIAAGLAPLLGLNLCLLGCLRLGRLKDDVKCAGVAGLLLGVLALAAVHRSARAPRYADYLAVGLAGWLLASALLLPALTGFVAAGAVLGLSVMVAKQRVHGRGFVLLACWLLPLLEQAGTPRAVLLATVLLALPTVLLVRRRFFGAAFVVVAVILGYAALDLARHDQGRFVAVVLCGIGLVLSMLYELAVPMREFSTFRLLLGQFPVIGAMMLMTHAVLPQGIDIRWAVWLFAGAVGTYQLIRITLERAAVPTRITWVALALAAAATAELELVSTFAVACQLVAVAACSHVAGILLGASVLADSGVVILIYAIALLASVKAAANLAIVVAGVVAGVALVLASQRFVAAPPLPWWSGFLRKQHAALLVSILKKVVTRVAELGFVKLFFGWVGLVVTWVRFAWDAAATSDIRPFVNLAGHAWLALFVGQRFAEWVARAFPARANLESIVYASLCNAYGVVLFAWGLTHHRRFTRLLALGVVVAPGVARAVSSNWIRVDELAWLLVTTGSALAVVGLMAKRGAEEPEAASIPPP